MKYHPDFDLPWCKTILDSRTSPVLVLTEQRPQQAASDESVSNSMFNQTLYTPTAIRSHLSFQRPTSEADSICDWECCYLLSIGSGLDGKTGRAHGGFDALILDQMTGNVAAMVSGAAAPATATMTVDYKAPVDTPSVIFCRGWAVETQGRKVWVKATIEDGAGKLLANGKSLFVKSRPAKM